MQIPSFPTDSSPFDVPTAVQVGAKGYLGKTFGINTQARSQDKLRICLLIPILGPNAGKHQLSIRAGKGPWWPHTEVYRKVVETSDQARALWEKFFQGKWPEAAVLIPLREKGKI